jgi:hypothetical protein
MQAHVLFLLRLFRLGRDSKCKLKLLRPSWRIFLRPLSAAVSCLENPLPLPFFKRESADPKKGWCHHRESRVASDLPLM